MPDLRIRRAYYLHSEMTAERFTGRSYDQLGKLTVVPGQIRFESKTGRLVIESVDAVSFTMQGADTWNHWVMVRYTGDDAPAVAYFGDGSFRGWGGIYGGTRRLYEAVRAAFPAAAEIPGDAVVSSAVTGSMTPAQLKSAMGRRLIFLALAAVAVVIIVVLNSR